MTDRRGDLTAPFVVGYAEGAVRVRVSRALTRLADELEARR